MRISKVATYFPDEILTTEMLSKEFLDVDPKRLINKLGIKKRHISGSGEYASDMAVKAIKNLVSSGVDIKNVGYIIFCTQTPDFLLPNTACLIHQQLNFSKNVGAVDVNVGCSAYIYGLSLAYGLISTKQVDSVLLITADAYTKILDKPDKAARLIFGDAATATLLTGSESAGQCCFVFGTDGLGAKNLYLPNSGMRGFGLVNKNCSKLHMNGAEIMNFALTIIPDVYNKLLIESKVKNSEIKYYVFHQANQYLLECLRDKLAIDPEKFIIDMSDTGNTVSSSIPIILSNLIDNSKLSENDTILLIGFGVGYSWAGCVLNIKIN